MARRLNVVILAVTASTLAVTGVAHAAPPSQTKSSWPAFIRMVGSSGGAADSLSGEFSVVVRNTFDDLLPHSMVTLDLSACPDIRVASDQLNPNVTVDCTSHTVGAFTDASGVVTFTVVGGSWAAGAYSGARCARLYADNVLLGATTIAAFDLDGTGGVSAGDISVWLGDLGSRTYRARSDFNGDGRLSAADMSIWLGVRDRSGSTTTGVTCP